MLRPRNRRVGPRGWLPCVTVAHREVSLAEPNREEGEVRKVVAVVAGFICLAAVAGGTLVFGGELSEFARRSCVAVLAIAFLVLGAGFMTSLFGVGGALVI